MGIFGMLTLGERKILDFIEYSNFYFKYMFLYLHFSHHIILFFTVVMIELILYGKPYKEKQCKLKIVIPMAILAVVECFKTAEHSTQNDIERQSEP